MNRRAVHKSGGKQESKITKEIEDNLLEAARWAPFAGTPLQSALDNSNSRLTINVGITKIMDGI